MPQDAAKPKGEYPAAVNLSRNVWLLSNGFGSSYIIHVEGDGPAALLVAQWDLLMDGSSTPVPFQVHCAASIDPGHALAVISSSGPHVSSSNVKEQYIFDIWGVKIPLPSSATPVVSHPGPRPFEVVWRRQGTHIPLYVNYVPEQSAFLLLGGSGYAEYSSRPEPSPDEMGPMEDNLNGAAPQSPPPYSWTQAGDSVTIAFGLPGLTNKNHIYASFEHNKLSLRVGSPSWPQPSYVGAPLWDTIDPPSSVWTWERGTSTKAGLLTLYLEKGHPGTRWSSVFQQGFETVEVPETLDPSELANIRDVLDKYTASLQEGGGLGHGVPSLAEGERDAEVDSSVGHAVQLTWAGGNNNPSDDLPASVLSLPLPGIPQQPVSLIIKSDIDGLLFDTPPIWKHAATYPALAFVLASKRDTRFTYHLNSQAVLAFESGARSDGSGNVYVYRGCNRGEKWAKQGVFQQGPGSGALIGAGAVVGKNGEAVVLCLSERELMVCQHVV